MAKRVGVVLSGCGFKDGAEIHESVIAMLALDRAGCAMTFFAPDRDQAQVVDHQSEEKSEARRNVRSEAARISRGSVRPLSEAEADDLDALVLPGGFGAALNLSTFATEGAGGSVDADLAALLEAMHAARKPIGAICIAPGPVALVLGRHGPRLTIGHDPATAAEIEKTGAIHVPCDVEDDVSDTEHRIVSTPAYMLGPGIKDVAAGIEKLVGHVLEMA
jgi:enhancing lycopene biosynthesis protein 2